ncbi:MAG: NAD(P)-dependent oxidoreductase, partial [Candidatus Omnitrophota bacterium]
SYTEVNSALIDRLLPDLKVIIRGGHGLDNVDVDYARSKKIKVEGTQGSEVAVAAWALRAVAAAEQDGLTFQEDEAPTSFFTLSEWTQALEKKVAKENDEAKKDRLRERADKLFAPVGRDTIDSLKGKTIGIIGFGFVGRQLAAASRDLGMKVLVNSPSLEKDPDPAKELGYEVVSKEDIYRTSHFVVPVTGLYLEGPRRNAGMIGQAEVDLMLQNKKLIALVNPDREGLVDEMAVERLVRGGAQYLVDEVPDSEFLKERARYTPHVAASTQKAEDGVVRNTAAVLARVYPKVKEQISGARLAAITAIDAGNIGPFKKEIALSPKVYLTPQYWRQVTTLIQYVNAVRMETSRKIVVLRDAVEVLGEFIVRDHDRFATPAHLSV